jgi:predicted dehydrogenase
VVDVVEPVARRAKNRYGFRAFASDWRRAVENPRVDCVDICISNKLHGAVAIAAAEAGKHVFCEKPLANTVEEGNQMVQAVEAAGVVNMIGFNYRHLPASMTAKEMIDSHQLGEIRHFRTLFAQDFAASPQTPFSWRFSAAEAGAGSIATMGSHALDLARFLIGDVECLTAMMRTFVKERVVSNGDIVRDVDVDDMTGLLMRFRAGASGIVETTWLAQGHKHHLGWEVNGARGTLQFNSERMNELRWYDASDLAERQGFRTLLMGPAFPGAEAFVAKPGMGMGYADALVIELKRFLSSIARQGSAKPSFRDGLEVCRITEAALASAVERRWVHLCEVG